jgi:hypothetical protein
MDELDSEIRNVWREIVASIPASSWKDQVLKYAAHAWELHNSVRILSNAGHKLAVIVLLRSLFERVLIIDQMTNPAIPNKEQEFADWGKKQVYELSQAFQPDTKWETEYQAANARWKKGQWNQKISQLYENSRLSKLLREQGPGAELYETFYKLACTHSHGDPASAILLEDLPLTEDLDEDQMLSVVLIAAMMFLVQDGFGLHLENRLDELGPLIAGFTSGN